MKTKENFRGKFEIWIWGKFIDHAVQSLGYQKIVIGQYKNEYGTPIEIHNSFYIPDISAYIGSKTDLEKLTGSDLEQAIQYLDRLKEKKIKNLQHLLNKEIEKQKVLTGWYTLSRRLSKNPIIATLELKELHEEYAKFLMR